MYSRESQSITTSATSATSATSWFSIFIFKIFNINSSITLLVFKTISHLHNCTFIFYFLFSPVTKHPKPLQSLWQTFTDFLCVTLGDVDGMWSSSDPGVVHWRWVLVKTRVYAPRLCFLFPCRRSRYTRCEDTPPDPTRRQRPRQVVEMRRTAECVRCADQKPSGSSPC